MAYRDEQLIGDILEGGAHQEKAIRQLYEECFFMVREGRTKFRQLSDDELISAYNSAILALRQQLLGRRFRGDSALSTYLYKIFSNRSIDILRRKTSNRMLPLEYAPDISDDSSNPLANWIREEQIALVREKLSALGGVCEKILHYSEYLNYTAQEIAEAIGFSNANSVNSKKYSCLQKLRELMRSA